MSHLTLEFHHCELIIDDLGQIQFLNEFLLEKKSFSSLNHIEITFELQIFMGLVIETSAMMRFFTLLPN